MSGRLNNISPIAVFALDSSLDEVQSNAQAKVSSAVASRNIWLQTCNIDPDSLTRLYNKTFSHREIFGQQLNNILSTLKEKKESLSVGNM